MDLNWKCLHEEPLKTALLENWLQDSCLETKYNYIELHGLHLQFICYMLPLTAINHQRLLTIIKEVGCDTKKFVLVNRNKTIFFNKAAIVKSTLEQSLGNGTGSLRFLGP